MSIKQWKQSARIDEEGKPHPYLIGAREGDTFTVVFHADHLAEMEKARKLMRELIMRDASFAEVLAFLEGK